jgi:hypothetical protein
MKYYFLSPSLKGSKYAALLQWSLEECAKFSLVWQASFKFNTTAQNLERKLRPYLVQEEKTNEWPGTKIHGLPENIIRFYKLIPESAELLKEPGGIYNWLAPDYPEDLALYNLKGYPWFGSVAHERMSFFLAPNFSKEEVVNRIGNIKIEEKEINKDS